jgi:hypothetical protein
VGDAGVGDGGTIDAGSLDAGLTDAGLACVASRASPFNPSIFRSYPTNGTYSAIASADFNGDGMLDLALSGGLDGLIVLFGLEDGGLSSPSVLDAGNAAFPALAVADLNMDGAMDLIMGDFDPTNVGQNPVVKVFINDGEGRFAAPSSYRDLVTYVGFMATGDINGDGFPDLVVCDSYGLQFGAIQVFLNAGDGSLLQPFSLQTPDPSNTCWRLAVADLNHDGRADIAITDFGGPLYVMLSLPDGGFEGDTYYSPNVDAGYAYGGGIALIGHQGERQDLAYSINYELYVGWNAIVTSTLTILENDGHGHFNFGPQYALSPPTTGMEMLAADLSGECESDVIVAGTSSPSNFSANCGSVKGGAAFLDSIADGGLGAPTYLLDDFSSALHLPPSDFVPSHVALMGPVDSPRAVALGAYCGSMVSVIGDASKH